MPQSPMVRGGAGVDSSIARRGNRMMIASPATDGTKQWCRLSWRLEALRAGFAPEVANRLAFWRWLAAQRGETEERTIAGRGAVPKGAAT
jgi:hypothetical protein